ncbi:hypothetical protein JTB14_013603 [Gonioctena quinquepunctata]|nr:hypothetical protein JTB14_013603 [Gonioctena quinquepunctata]
MAAKLQDIPECLSDCELLEYLNVKNSKKRDEIEENNEKFCDASDSVSINNGSKHELEFKNKELLSNKRSTINYLESRVKEQEECVLVFKSLINGGKSVPELRLQPQLFNATERNQQRFLHSVEHHSNQISTKNDPTLKHLTPSTITARYESINERK